MRAAERIVAARLALGGIAFVSAIATACQPTCDYATNDCRSGQACAFVTPNRPPTCVDIVELDAEALPPFASGQEFWCSQSGRSAAGRSHSFQRDLFALDLASPSTGAVEIVAPVSGEVTVFDGCDERDTSALADNDSRCGAGYGNHVRIWDGHRLFLLAHMARVDVPNGPIERGQHLGLMGCSGRAGDRHVHFAITTFGKHDNRATILASPGGTGSVPVRARLRARRAGDEAGTPLWQDLFECSPIARPETTFVR